MRNSNDIAAIFITDLAGEGGHRVKATDASPPKKEGKQNLLKRWWLNQPIWKICASQIGCCSSPPPPPPHKFGWKFQKCLSCHHPVQIVVHDLQWTYRSWHPCENIHLFPAFFRAAKFDSRDWWKKHRIFGLAQGQIWPAGASNHTFTAQVEQWRITKRWARRWDENANWCELCKC